MLNDEGWRSIRDRLLRAKDNFFSWGIASAIGISLTCLVARYSAMTYFLSFAALLCICMFIAAFVSLVELGCVLAYIASRYGLAYVDCFVVDEQLLNFFEVEELDSIDKERGIDV